MGLAPALEHRFRPLSNGMVIPIFAFFSAGVAVDGIEGIKSAAIDPVALGIVAGIGFTVSLLVAELSFGTGSPHNDHAKAGIPFGSMLAAVIGGIMLLTRNAKYKKRAHGVDPDVYDN